MAYESSGWKQLHSFTLPNFAKLNKNVLRHSRAFSGLGLFEIHYCQKPVLFDWCAFWLAFKLLLPELCWVSQGTKKSDTRAHLRQQYRSEYLELHWYYQNLVQLSDTGKTAKSMNLFHEFYGFRFSCGCTLRYHWAEYVIPLGPFDSCFCKDGRAPQCAHLEQRSLSVWPVGSRALWALWECLHGQDRAPRLKHDLFYNAIVSISFVRHTPGSWSSGSTQLLRPLKDVAKWFDTLSRELMKYTRDSNAF